MSRQRLRPSLGESSQIVCPRCKGQGTVRGVESLALSILRIIEEEAMKEKTGRVVARVPVAVGTYLLNEKREILVTLEQRHKLDVILIPTPSLETPHYDIKRVRSDELEGEEGAVSHELLAAAESEEEPEEHLPGARPVEVEKPAVQRIAPPVPAPVIVREQMPAPSPAAAPGLLRRIWTSLFGTGVEVVSEAPETAEQEPRRARDTGNGGRGSRGRSGGGRRRTQGARRGEGGPQQRDTSGQKRRQPAGADVKAKEPKESKERKEAAAETPADDQSAQPQAPQQDTAAKTGQGRSGSRRGRRGGRRRSGQRRDGTQAANTSATGGDNAADAKSGDKPQTETGAAQENKVTPLPAPAPKTEVAVQGRSEPVRGGRSDSGDRAAPKPAEDTGSATAPPPPRAAEQRPVASQPNAGGSGDSPKPKPVESSGAESPRGGDSRPAPGPGNVSAPADSARPKPVESSKPEPVPGPAPAGDSKKPAAIGDE
jgi:ribonuclease E